MRRITIALYAIILICFSLKLVTIDNGSVNEEITKNLNNVPLTYDIYVDLEENTLTVFLDNCLIKTYPVAVGTIITPSPAGIWRIVDKNKWGDAFGGNWMGLNVPWGKYGIHGTTKPWSIGADASHGCIRMYNEDAEDLYDIVPLGTTVVLSNGPYGAFSKNKRIIIPGDRGSDVLAIQRKLKELGFYRGYLSGIYDDNLKFALFAFQESKGYTPHNEISKWDLKLMGLSFFE